MKLKLIVLSLLVAGFLLNSCSRGYYAHLPRAKTQKQTSEVVTIQPDITSSILERKITTDAIISKDDVIEQTEQHINTKTLKSTLKQQSKKIKSTKTVSFYHKLKNLPKKVIKYKPNEDGLLIALTAFLIIALVVIGILAIFNAGDGGCILVLFFVLILIVVILLLGVLIN